MNDVKPRAILLNDTDRPSVKRVYMERATRRLQEETELYAPLIDKSNIGAHREAAARAEVAFSTWGMPHFTREEIREYFPALKAVFYAAGSVQGFAAEFLDENIKVFSAWAANGVPVAQVTASMILLANKGFYQAYPREKQAFRSGKLDMPGNFNVRVGLLGAGMIGRMVIKYLKAMQDGADELELLVFDPFLPEAAARELGVRLASIEEVFATCQTISNHLANKKEIEGIISEALLCSMPDTAVFINTGRGAQVSEPGLYRALTEKPTRAAVLDVTWPEPPVPNDKLMLLPNVFLSPHIAGSIGNECERMAIYMLDECARFMRGEAARYEVTREMLATMA